MSAQKKTTKKTTPKKKPAKKPKPPVQTTGFISEAKVAPDSGLSFPWDDDGEGAHLAASPEAAGESPIWGRYLEHTSLWWKVKFYLRHLGAAIIGRWIF